MTALMLCVCLAMLLAALGCAVYDLGLERGRVSGAADQRALDNEFVCERADVPDYIPEWME